MRASSALGKYTLCKKISKLGQHQTVHRTGSLSEELYRRLCDIFGMSTALLSCCSNAVKEVNCKCNADSVLESTIHVLVELMFLQCFVRCIYYAAIVRPAAVG